jgi:hypothetical protein
LIVFISCLGFTVFQLSGPAQNPRNPRVIHFPHQAIGGQQVQVTRRNHKLDHVRVDFILGAYRPGDDIPHGRGFCLCRGQLPQPHLLVHQGMVMGQAFQPAVAHAITAAVSHVRDPGAVAPGCHSHQRGPHARSGRILFRTAMHAVVGRVHRLLERLPGQHAVAHGVQHSLHRHPAGDFPSGCAAHAITHYKIADALFIAEVQPIGVFIAFPGSPLIGRTGCLVFQQFLLLVWHLLFPKRPRT